MSSEINPRQQDSIELTAREKTNKVFDLSRQILSALDKNQTVRFKEAISSYNLHELQQILQELDQNHNSSAKTLLDVLNQSAEIPWAQLQSGFKLDYHSETEELLKNTTKDKNGSTFSQVVEEYYPPQTELDQEVEMPKHYQDSNGQIIETIKDNENGYTLGEELTLQDKTLPGIHPELINAQDIIFLGVDRHHQPIISVDDTAFRVANWLHFYDLFGQKESAPVITEETRKMASISEKQPGIVHPEATEPEKGEKDAKEIKKQEESNLRENPPGRDPAVFLPELFDALQSKVSTSKNKWVWGIKDDFIRLGFTANGINETLIDLHGENIPEQSYKIREDYNALREYIGNRRVTSIEKGGQLYLRIEPEKEYYFLSGEKVELKLTEYRGYKQGDILDVKAPNIPPKVKSAKKSFLSELA